MDELIEQLRARAADPERRADARPTQLWAGVKALDLDGLLGALRDVQTDLARALDASSEGRVDPQAPARAEEIQRAMSTPVDSGLPRPADPTTVDDTEDALGFPLPIGLRRAYCEVADGGRARVSCPCRQRPSSTGTCARARSSRAGRSGPTASCLSSTTTPRSTASSAERAGC